MEITFGRQKHKIQELQDENRRLVKTQELLVDNILAVQERETVYTGNRYKEYAQAVLEVSLKYQGKADWGGLQVGSIVDLRAAYIVGQGIKIKKVDDSAEAQAAYDFAMRLIDKAELDHELAQDLAKEAEIEGKTLIKLFPYAGLDADGNPVTDIGIRWISWTTNKYEVHTNADDYLLVENITYQPTGRPQVTLNPDQCVYKRFAGRLDIPNETMPRVAKCLTQIENLDKALRDWREINRLYAAPTPYFKCETTEQSKNVNAQIASLNWKIGKAFAATAEFDYKQPDSSGQAAIESEIITLMKLISGTTGVPIHFLGAPELTTKYGAANEGLLELIAMSTSKEREVWRGCYQELITKAMKMWNDAMQKTGGTTALDPEKIIVEIPLITKEQWDRIISTWLPLYREGVVQHATLLSQVPGLDVEAEMEAKAEADASMLQDLKKENADLKFGQQADKGDESNDNNQ